MCSQDDLAMARSLLFLDAKTFRHVSGVTEFHSSWRIFQSPGIVDARRYSVVVVVEPSKAEKIYRTAIRAGIGTSEFATNVIPCFSLSCLAYSCVNLAVCELTSASDSVPGQRILTIDGGGLRGLISLENLREIEKLGDGSI